MVVLCGIAGAAQVNLAVGNGSGYPGGTATSQVTFSATSSPAAVSFRILFDSTKVTVANVQAGAVVTAAQKQMDWDVPTAGTLAVAIYGVNQTLIANGTLATVTFNILGSVVAPDSIALDGGTQSSSDANGQPLTTAITDGTLSANVCTTPAAPGSVSATGGTLSDRVRVTWGASSGATSYLLYRSTSSNSASAVFITSIVGTTYDDFSAAPATSQSSGGCGGGSTPKVTTYFYWIRAQNACSQGALSASDSGYRGQAKAASSEATFEAALPGKAGGYVPLDGAIALRLRSADPIDGATVWGLVESDTLQDESVRWIPSDESSTDGWVVYTPTAFWTPGEIVWMSAGASTHSGVQLPSIRYAFKADPDGAVSSDVTKDAGSRAALTLVDSQDFPVLIESVGPAYAIAPESVFDVPETVLVPVPAGIDAASVEVYYLSNDGEGPAWHRGDSVDGWLVESRPEGESLALTVRHGGVICVGYRSDAVNVAAAGLLTAGNALDNVVLAGLVVGVLALAHWRRSRTAAR
jgi:hypothetical protein